jgi:hypothetical protein
MSEWPTRPDGDVLVMHLGGGKQRFNQTQAGPVSELLND